MLSVFHVVFLGGCRLGGVGVGRLGEREVERWYVPIPGRVGQFGSGVVSLGHGGVFEEGFLLEGLDGFVRDGPHAL